MAERDARPTDGPVRALHILEALAGMQQPASLLAVATAVRHPKVKVYRALRALQDEGYVDHVGRDGYRVGGRSLALAALLAPRPDMVGCARSTMTRLAREARQTATLQLRSGVHRVSVLTVLAVARAPPPMAPGERAPLTSGCSGLVILAHMPEQDVDPIVAARPPRERRPDPGTLARIRDAGYAVSESHNHAELHGVAAALLDPDDGTPFGSLALVGAPQRFGTPALTRVVGPLLRAAGELAPALTRFLGPRASTRQPAMDVVIQELTGP